MRLAASALIRILALVLVAMWIPSVAKAETPIPPSPTMWVTDKAGYLSAQTVRTLNAELGAYDHTTGHQVLVYVAPTTGGVPIEDWAVNAFQKWKVGRKGLDDGLVLFIFTQDHKLRIEVGYGLEDKVTDVYASRIIRNTIAPALKAGQPDRGVTDGVNQIVALISGGAGAAATSSITQSGANSTTITPLELGIITVVLVLVIFVIVIIAIRSPGAVVSFGANSGSSSWNDSGGGGGGGGFSGGGGSSGGGGASGSW